MAIASMSKLNLVGMSYDKNALLDVLHKTGAVEVKCHAEKEGLSYGVEDLTEAKSYLSRFDAALDILCAAVDAGDKDRKVKSDLLKDGFDVSYSEFMAAGNLRRVAEETQKKVNELCDEKIRLENELGRADRFIRSALPYSSLEDSLLSYSGTTHVDVKIGTIPATEEDRLRESVSAVTYAEVKELSRGDDETLVLVAAHRSVSTDVDAALSAVGFSECPFMDDKSGKETYEEALALKRDVNVALKNNEEELYGLRDMVRPLKTYSDYVNFAIEKRELSEKMLTTERTFLLEAYVPVDAVPAVTEAIASFSGAVHYEFSEPAEDEIPPTLMKNKAVFANFETITNMYSPPNSKEMDPTIVMAFFYSLFMGFIMADVGYGIIMLVAGLVVYFKTRSRKSGLNSLSGVFAAGGVFAIIMGVLYNSYFGWSFDALPKIIPDAQSSMWSFAGISVPSVLILAMIIGCVQLAAGYVCKIVQCMRRGRYGDGICEGMTWAVFAAGAALAIIGLVDEFDVGILMYVGAIMAGVGLVAAMFTAGRKEKIVGKFTKGFGALYSIINFASDILSYARLYGLMLSGAVVANLVSSYGVEFISGGNPGFIILGLVILLVGHGFNLAMGLLSAYIHDARLQYVEFYGKFYEGEGELFAPIGSGNRHVYLNLRDTGTAAAAADAAADSVSDAGAAPARVAGPAQSATEIR